MGSQNSVKFPIKIQVDHKEKVNNAELLDMESKAGTQGKCMIDPLEPLRWLLWIGNRSKVGISGGSMKGSVVSG